MKLEDYIESHPEDLQQTATCTVCMEEMDVDRLQNMAGDNMCKTCYMEWVNEEMPYTLVSLIEQESSLQAINDYLKETRDILIRNWARDMWYGEPKVDPEWRDNDRF